MNEITPTERTDKFFTDRELARLAGTKRGKIVRGNGRRLGKGMRAVQRRQRGRVDARTAQ